jgi:hypothetical protein
MDVPVACVFRGHALKATRNNAELTVLMMNQTTDAANVALLIC